MLRANSSFWRMQRKMRPSRERHTRHTTINPAKSRNADKKKNGKAPLSAKSGIKVSPKTDNSPGRGMPVMPRAPLVKSPPFRNARLAALVRHRVTMAQYTPRRRRTGNPINTPMMAAMSPANGRASQKDISQRVVRMATAYPPMRAKAPWLMLMRPMAKVSHTPKLMKESRAVLAATVRA